MLCSSLVYSQTTTVTLTTSGPGTYNIPANATKISVEAWGGGGKGGSRTTTGVGGGGGGGAYSRSVYVVNPSSDYAYFVGGGSTTTDPGGDSWFNYATTIMAKGGGSVADNTDAGATGGDSGAGYGQVKYSGGTGATGIAGNYGGGGGSSAGTTSNGTNATGSEGGTAPTGGGNGGAGGTGANSDGTIGTAPGGGGGGSRRQGGTRIGGNGANGQIRITYSSFSLNTTSATSPVCSSYPSEITISSNATGLPDGAYTITYSLTGDNTSGPHTVEVTVSSNSATFSTINFENSGATTITINNIQNASYGNNLTTNNTATITVNPSPQGNLTANGPFCYSGAGQLTFTATEGVSPYTVVYFDGVANRTANSVSSGSPFDVFTTPVTATTAYAIVSVTGNNSCVRTSGFTTNMATITVNSPFVEVSTLTHTKCPDLDPGLDFEPNNSNYNPGGTEITFVVTRSGLTGVDWDFDYELTLSASSLLAGSPIGQLSGNINVLSTENVYELVFWVVNIPGTPIDADIEISNITVGACTVSFDPSHENTVAISSMPVVGPFD